MISRKDCIDENQWWIHCCIWDKGKCVPKRQGLFLFQNKLNLHNFNKKRFFIWKYIFTGLCIPYSKTACLNVSEESNLQLGNHERAFIGNYPIKGCHAKNGIAFFGTDATLIDHQTSLIMPYFRPNGYDCGTFCTFTIEKLFS